VRETVVKVDNACYNEKSFMKKIILLVGVLLLLLFIILYAESSNLEKNKGTTHGFLDAFLYFFDFQVGGTVKVKPSDTPAANVPNGQNVPANDDTCGGFYTGYNALTSPYKNFGDPLCDFGNDPDKLYGILLNLDPGKADTWFSIAQCESGFNPNAYLAASTSGRGAYGLFQMNPAGEGNGQYDVGNVVWGLQISNAINYNKEIKGSFDYWACAP